jgi:hypothetical protein
MKSITTENFMTYICPVFTMNTVMDPLSISTIKVGPET